MAIEVLAPAGSMEALRAAVRSGADAVYFGAAQYSARAFAQNFTGQELAEAISYCHRAGVQVHVTVNTLMAGRELEAAEPLLRELCELGTDALIVQDAGLFAMAREICPEIPLHASTQMAIHSLDGALFARDLGASRVVLARELPFEDIAYISKNAPVETEMFLHGSLCVCHSGQCYMSAVIGRRSGNRGRCAQPCRMEYQCGKREAALLSLKDLSYLPRMEEIGRLGVASLKIEGRMKRPEYVAAVTRTAVRAVREGKPPAPEDMEMLARIFSRSGFTDGYADGEKKRMHGVRGEAPEEYEEILRTERERIGKETPRVALQGRFAASFGTACTLELRDGDGHTVCATGDLPQKATRRAAEEAEVREALMKLGDTPYFFETLDCTLAEGLFLPRSALNALRRDAVSRLDEARTAKSFGTQPRLRREAIPNPKQALSYYAVFLDGDEIPDNLRGAAGLFVPPGEVEKALGRGCAVGVTLPPVCFDRELPALEEQLKKCRELGVETALCSNVGQLEVARRLGFSVMGNFQLNAFNSESVSVFAQKGVSQLCLSSELRFAQIRDISKEIPCGAVLYGRLPLMVTETCFCEPCSGACKLPDELCDRMGQVFPVRREAGCRNVIYNSQPIYLADHREDFADLGLSFGLLFFTVERKAEAAQILQEYAEGGESPAQFTRGLFYKGVE